MNSYRHLQGHTYVTPFTAHTRISDVILGSASALLIISRFGIPLGFGDQSIGQVCQEHGVDVKTLLLLLNSSIIDGYEPTPELIASVHLDSLLKYLINSHSYLSRLPPTVDPPAPPLGDVELPPRPNVCHTPLLR